MELKDTVADDVIEEVKGAQLQKMVDELDYLVVFFCEDDKQTSSSFQPI